MVFSNFPEIKQLNKKKNRIHVNIMIFLNCDLLELEIRDSYKKLFCDCFFPFLTTMFSSSVVPAVQ